MGDGERETSRRDFLRRAGAGAAGLAIGGSAGAAITSAAMAHPPEFEPLPQRSVPGFDHIVVVMFENRSFDNLLGHLYSADEKSRAEFDGLAQGTYSNPGASGEDVPAYVYDGPTDTVMQSPQPDPGEAYPHINTRSCSARSTRPAMPTSAATACGRRSTRRPWVPPPTTRAS
ncbi:alkaline phosphatase family protein [Microbacterium sp.]|uniref:alkaline phosphatase family protein n=1 Tax=Microbacterium sp. TaxID=51671 RepID=UPI0037C7D24F